MKASLRDEVNPLGVRIASVFLGRTATERQKMIFEIERRGQMPVQFDPSRWAAVPEPIVQAKIGGPIFPWPLA